MNHSLLASSTGYSKDNKWKKLYDRIPEHQESISHKKCYVAWRNFQKIIGCSATISVQLTPRLRVKWVRIEGKLKT